jgi:hypothetical protein
VVDQRFYGLKMGHNVRSLPTACMLLYKITMAGLASFACCPRGPVELNQ